MGVGPAMQYGLQGKFTVVGSAPAGRVNLDLINYVIHDIGNEVRIRMAPANNYPDNNIDYSPYISSIMTDADSTSELAFGTWMGEANATERMRLTALGGYRYNNTILWIGNCNYHKGSTFTLSWSRHCSVDIQKRRRQSIPSNHNYKRNIDYHIFSSILLS